MAITFNRVSLPVSSTGTTFTITSSTGNLIAIIIVCDTAATVSAVSGNTNGAYILCPVHATDSGGAGNVYLAYKLGAAAGDTTITVTHAAGGVSIAAYDFSGTNPVFDSVSAASNGTAAIPTNGVTASQAGACVAGFATLIGQGGSANAPFTLDVMSFSVTTNFAYGMHDVNGASGLQTATFGFNSTQTHWSSLVASFVEAPGPVWTLMNSASKFQFVGGDDFAAPAFANPLTAGSILVVGVVMDNPVSVGSVTDTAGNTYVDAGPGTKEVTSGGHKIQLFIAQNSHTTAANIVTVHYVTGNGSCGLIVGEFTGNATSGQPDKNTGAALQTSSGSGLDTVTMSALTPTLNNSLLVAVLGDLANPMSKGTTPNAFAQLDNAGDSGQSSFLMMEWFVQPTAASVSPTAGTGGTDSIAYVWAVLKPAATLIEQAQFRFRADDNNEASASYLAAINTSITRAAGINGRLRVQLDTTLNEPSKTFQIEYRKQGNTTWHKVGQ